MKRKLISILSIITLLTTLVSLNVNAADATATFKADKTTVEAGGTFTVTLQLKYADGLSGAETNITYDATKLELTDRKEGNSSTTGMPTEMESGKYNIALMESADTAELSYVLTFKVKDTVSVGDTLTISTEEITVVDKDIKDLPNISKQSVTVTVASASSGNEDDNQGGNKQANQNEGNKATADEGNNTNSGGYVNITNKNATQSSKTMPYTGRNLIVGIVVVALGTVAAVSYVTYRRYKNI